MSDKAKQILIVDDNEMVRRHVSEFLATLTTHTVGGVASNGEEALQKSRELRPDVIFLDINMPGKDGLETARLLRQELPNAQIFMMTHHDVSAVAPAVKQVGANGCVDKSRLAVDLLACIRGNPSK